MSGDPSTSGRWRTPSSDDSDSSIEETSPTIPAAHATATARDQGQQQHQLIARLEAHQKELERLNEEKRLIQRRCRDEQKSIDELTRQINRGGADDGADDDDGRDGAAIKDYSDSGRFEWGARLKEQMGRVFGIGAFRLAQEGVCNANMDRRDIICIMPTGGGKSLTYQLPATLMPGCTLVVSPLVSLIKDQDMDLQEKQVECLTFTAKTPLAKKQEGYSRLRNLTAGKEVKLCYVTPERLGKSDEFRTVLKAMFQAHKLARIVIDEAHCVTQWGRDYRPQYRQLADLRHSYPGVPILALSATCRNEVIRDLVAILGLPPLTDGTAAERHGTVLFQSPLYRENLHYKVLPKSSDRLATVREMVNYILERYPNETGIVYCLSREDAKRVATQLDEESQGRIKTGFYHSEITDQEKEDLYESWLMGKTKVMCATIAFGLGINKANVRFVFHHSIPQSLESLYQESGRAGRDGKDADCILYYRFLDALRGSGMKADTDWQQEDVHSMIKFCLDLKECRKLTFAKHFSSADFSWAEDNTPCGHCDNCLRDPATVVQKDVTSEAERVLAIARALASRNTNFTATGLAQAARGNGDLAKRLHLAQSDKITLSSLNTEALIAHLLLEGYLEKFTIENSYTVQVYLKPARSQSFGKSKKLVIQFQTAPNNQSPKRKRNMPCKAGDNSARDNNNNSNSTNDNNSEEAEAKEEVQVEDGDDDGFGNRGGDSEDGDSEYSASSAEDAAGGSPPKRRRSNSHHHATPSVFTVESDSDQEMTVNVSSAQPDTSRRLRRSRRRRVNKTQKQKQGQGQGALRRGQPSGAVMLPDDDEIIEISSD